MSFFQLRQNLDKKDKKKKKKKDKKERKGERSKKDKKHRRRSSDSDEEDNKKYRYATWNSEETPSDLTNWTVSFSFPSSYFMQNQTFEARSTSMIDSASVRV